MSIKHITTDELRKMDDQEGLILQTGLTMQ